jgi:hypothetical protein
VSAIIVSLTDPANRASVSEVAPSGNVVTVAHELRTLIWKEKVPPAPSAGNEKRGRRGSVALMSVMPVADTKAKLGGRQYSSVPADCGIGERLFTTTGTANSWQGLTSSGHWLLAEKTGIRGRLGKVAAKASHVPTRASAKKGRYRIVDFGFEN